MSKVYTKKQRVMNHLARGNEDQVEAYGNWEVSSRTLDNGVTCYGMDFHGYTDNPFAIRAGIC